MDNNDEIERAKKLLLNNGFKVANPIFVDGEMNKKTVPNILKVYKYIQETENIDKLSDSELENGFIRWIEKNK